MSDRRNGSRPVHHHFSEAINRQLHDLRCLDNWHGTTALAFDTFVIGLAIFGALELPAVFYPLTVFVIGSRQRALATLLHEAAHQTLCANRMLNFAIGCLGGWLVFQSFFPYQRSHVHRHHPFLGGLLDPDFVNYVRQKLFDARPETFYRDHLIPVLFGLRAPGAFANLVRDRLIPRGWLSQPRPEKMEFATFILFWSTVVLALAWAGLFWPLVFYWMIPFFLGFIPVNWLIELGEHFPIISRSRLDLEMTRNRLGHPLELFFFGMHAENWHLVHHLRPGIPFWNVRKAHEIMLQDADYAAVHRESGGLLSRGPQGQPSILSVIAKQLATLQTIELQAAENHPVVEAGDGPDDRKAA